MYVAGVDYDVPGTGPQFTVDIPAGATTQPFSVNIIDDNMLENDETFMLTIIQTNSTVVTTGSRSMAIVTIRDDEGLCTSSHCLVLH